MTNETPRKRNGQFSEGSTGNPKGRPPRRRIDPKLPAARRDVIMRVADRVVDVKINGQVEQLSIYEACVYQLALGGAQGNRVSAQKFIDLAMETSMEDLANRRFTRNWIHQMNLLDVENEELRKKVGGKRTGVVVLPWEEFHHRLDDGSHDEKRAPPDEDG